jgi:hypothetical protein
MSITSSWGRRTGRSKDRATGRVRAVLGTRGQRSHLTRPQPEDAHRMPRLQPPPFV